MTSKPASGPTIDCLCISALLLTMLQACCFADPCDCPDETHVRDLTEIVYAEDEALIEDGDLSSSDCDVICSRDSVVVEVYSCKELPRSDEVHELRCRVEAYPECE